ncbi:hypothetical protein L596_021309 [Steinernema carpocapsae]|uniref:TAFH domain-containing protein n=1 Tax=Steinernema carpocapsae TaxID=34508 RepID=A0A4U5MJ67_STECR|nr:hypothetical protein L596_021309 [Steinernema carpocapsae]
MNDTAGGQDPPSPGLPDLQDPSQDPPSQPQNQQAQPLRHQDERIMKCARFFRTLVGLTTHQTPILNLVREILMGIIDVDAFIQRLERALVTEHQPSLRPFLLQTVPLLREQMRREELIVDQINLSQTLGIMPSLS